MEFKKMGLVDSLINGLSKEKINKPTKVQHEVYKKILDGKDLIVQSETGSGKTLAYLVPLYERKDMVERGNKVIILVPTHELAMQVHRQIERLSKNSGINIKSTPVVGNVNIVRQIENLKEKPQIVVGTAGRILELIKKKKIGAHLVKTIIIDEADKLLDENNIELTKSVIKCTMKERQLLLFSASIPLKTIEAAKLIMKEPQIIKANEKLEIPKNIEHMYFIVERRDKLETMRKLSKILKPKKAMVFINKLSDIEEATQKLKYHQFKAECIHGSNIKADRKKAIDDFKNGKIEFLVATDIAARGIHIDNITTVFNVSIPEEPIDYLHRAGRCGRNGENGLSILIITKEELERIKKYQKSFGINILHKKMYQGKIVKG